MNRLALFFFFAALFVHGNSPFCGAQNSAPTPQQTHSGNNIRNPNVQDTSYHRPPIETAVIEGVSPGKTTLEQLNRLWGDPKLETIDGDIIVRLYSMEPLNHIEVTLQNDLVSSIVIILETPFPEEDVRGSLQSELLRSKPVLIPDETGGLIGEIFPEKGVMFIFVPQRSGRERTGRELLVERIAITPVAAEPFVQRAEAVLYDQPTEARRDLIETIKLDPGYARAYWLLAQIDLWEGHVESAILYVEKSIQLDDQRPAYHLTFAQALIQMNRIEEAKQYIQETILICDRFPHEKAKALTMLGELFRISRNPDHQLAYDCHREAINLATTLLSHSNPTISLTAKDVLFEAHLAAAKAVAWGHWNEGKDKAIKMWIEQAKVLARDPALLAARRYSREYQFKIAACSLTTLVAMPENINIDIYIEDVIDAGNTLVKSTYDPILKAKYFWDTGISLYDAVQIFQLRQQFSSALRYGELAAKYMEEGLKDRNNETDWYLLGRLYYRLGLIHALGNQNHRAAIESYDKAKRILDVLLPRIDAGAWGAFGEMLVSMGVSYWATGKQEEAIKLTERGVQQLERGLRAKMFEASLLEAPYKNLAKMYHDIGNQEESIKYMRLATSVGGEKNIR